MALFTLVLLVLAVNPAHSNEAYVSGLTGHYAVGTNTQALYKVDYVSYNYTSQMPITKDDGFGGSYQIGNLTKGDLVTMSPSSLPGDILVQRLGTVSFDSPAARESWSMDYNATLSYPGWPSVADNTSMPFFKPFVPVYDNWVNVANAWNLIANSPTNISSYYDSGNSQLFLSAGNNSLEVPIVEATWVPWPCAS